MFTLTINTANDVFADGDAPLEVARILKALASRLEDGCATESGPLKDVNGNHVGVWSLTDENPTQHGGWSTAETYAYEETWSNLGEPVYAKVVDAAVAAVVADTEITDVDLGEVAIKAFYEALNTLPKAADSISHMARIGDRTKINRAEVGEEIREHVDGILRGA